MPQFLNIANFSKIPTTNFRFENLGSAPSPAAGDIGYTYYDTTLGYPRTWTGSAWIDHTNIGGTGTITSAMIQDGTIVNVDINASAAIAYAKLNLTGSIVNADVAAAAAIAYAKLNLAGSIVNADIAAGAAIAYSKIAAPTATVSMGGQVVQNVAAPVAATDAANKAYVDASRAGLDPKQSVRVNNTSIGSISYNSTAGASGRGQITTAPNVVDGVTLAVNDRVLQSYPDGSSGIYKVTTVGTGSTGVWDRADDFDADAEVTAGAFVFVTEGTSYSDTGWVLTTNDPIVIGGGSGTPLSWTQFSGPGTITAGAGLTSTGNTIDVVGTANRIVANANSIDISSSYVGQASITTLGTIATGVWNGTDVAVADGGTGSGTAAGARQNLAVPGRFGFAFLGDGTTTTFSNNHGLTLGASIYAIVGVIEDSTGKVVIADCTVTSTAVQVSFAVAPVASKQYNVLMVAFA